MSGYGLEFALDTLPSFALVGDVYEIKICVVHLPTKGIGRKKSTPIRINLYHDQEGPHRTRELLYEMRGGNEIPIEGIATIQLKFLQQQFFGNVVIAATGEEVEPTRIYKFKLARFQLHIHNFHKDTFFKDSFGKYSYIKTIVYLLGSQNRLIQDVMVPLQVSLRYQDTLEEVPSTTDKPALNLFDLHHRIEKGCSLIPFRIEVVSSSHNNRNFVFYVEPERNGRHNDGSILPCVSTSIEVKARLRPFNPERTPPKYNPNRYHQEQEMVRESARQMFNSGNNEIREMIGNELSSSSSNIRSNALSSPKNNININNNNTTPNQKQSSSNSKNSPNSNDLDINLGDMTLSDQTSRSQTPSPALSTISNISTISTISSTSSSSRGVKSSTSNITTNSSLSSSPTTTTTSTTGLSTTALAGSRGVSNTPNSPLVKVESSNTQSARSVFRGDLTTTTTKTPPVTPSNIPKVKSEPISRQNDINNNNNNGGDDDNDDNDDEDWVINFKKNSLVISGLELDRWEERILGGSRSSNSSIHVKQENSSRKVTSPTFSSSSSSIPIPTPISPPPNLVTSSTSSRTTPTSSSSSSTTTTTRQTRSSASGNR